MVVSEGAAGAGRGGYGADRQPPVMVSGVSEQQPQDLAARVSAGARDSHAYRLRHATNLCMTMHTVANSFHWSPPNVDLLRGSVAIWPDNSTLEPPIRCAAPR